MPSTIQSPQAKTTIGGMTPRATALSSAGLKDAWSQKIKDQSVFSARTTEQSYVDFIKRQLATIASGAMDPQTAEAKIRETLRDIGYSPETGFAGHEGEVPTATPGSMQDLSSSRRIQLIIDTNVKQARSLGQMAASENPTILYSTPAWKLTRTGARKKPRGDWFRRWEAAGKSVGWKGALKNGFVALKTSPIWQAIGDGIGGFSDSIGTPYPPFAFGSGMAWVGIGRREWQRLCKAEGSDDGLSELDGKAREIAKSKTDGFEVEKPRQSAIEQNPVLPGAVATVSKIPSPKKTKISTPDIRPYNPNLSSRLAVSRAVDDALSQIEQYKVAAGNALKNIEDSIHRVSVLSAEYPDSSEKIGKAKTTLDKYHATARGKMDDLKMLEGRVIGYGSTSETSPIPRSVTEQIRFDDEMKRLFLRARQSAKEASSLSVSVSMIGSAAIKTADRLIAEVANDSISEMRRELTDSDSIVESYIRDRSNPWLDRFNVENWWKSAKDAASQGRRSAFHRLMGFIKQKTEPRR